MKEYICKDDIKLDYSGLVYISPNDYEGVAQYFLNQIFSMSSEKVRPFDEDVWTPVDASYWRWKSDGAHVITRIKYKHEKCGRTVSKKENYCPECGAKMR